MKKTFLVLLATLLLVACTPNNKKEDELVTITVPTYKAGENIGAKLFEEQVSGFNKEYEGKYKIEVEAVPQASYSDKIKQLAQQKKLPPLIEQSGSGSIDPVWFEDVVIKNELFEDLKPWLDENPKIRDMMLEDSVEYNMVDGKLVSVPSIIVRPMFMYYNEDFVADDFNLRDMNSEEFVEYIEESGNKIAMQTGENAWTASLLWTALIANEEGGAEFLNSYENGELRDINHDVIIQSLEKLKALFKYASDGSLGGGYADVANNFMSENAAFIANGPWMVGEFSEEGKDKWTGDFHGDKVVGTMFFGNLGIASQKTRGYWIPKDADEKEKEAAKAFLSYINRPEGIELMLLTEGGMTPNYTPSDEYLASLEKDQAILFALNESMNDETRYVQSILDILPASVSETELSKYFPEFFEGKISVDEFVEAINSKMLDE